MLTDPSENRPSSSTEAHENFARCSSSTSQPVTLMGLLQRRAAEMPNELAYTFLANGEEEAERFTFGDLDRRARGVAAYLQGLGAERERALLIYPAGLGFIAAFFGCLYAGVVAVPVTRPKGPHSTTALRRLQSVARSCRPVVVLTESDVKDEMGDQRQNLGEFVPSEWQRTDTLPGDLSERWEKPDVEADDVVFLQYTSGSTADPRGVMVTHRNLLHNLECLRRFSGSDRTSVGVWWLPHFHDMGLMFGVLKSVFVGHPSYLMSPMAFVQRPMRWLEAIGRYRATISGGPNFGFELCVRKSRPEHRAALKLGTLKTMVNGAEPVFAETLDDFADAFSSSGLSRSALCPAYGLSENTAVVAQEPLATDPFILSVDAQKLREGLVVDVPADSLRAQRLVACGAVGSDMEVAIVDPETQCRVAKGTLGEIWVSGPSVARGYWGQPEATRETFEARIEGETESGPYLRTGDLGFLRDGRVFVGGRLKDLIILDGANHYPQDIERIVERSHPAIRPGGCVAFSVPVERVQRLVVLAELRSRWQHAEEAPDFAAVITAIRRAVAEDLEVRAHTVHLLEARAVPKTSSGKVQRGASRRAFLDGTLDVVA